MRNGREIDYEDILEWKKRFEKAKEMLLTTHGVDNGVYKEFAYLLKDFIFLVSFVESQLYVECDDEVYVKAKELQKGVGIVDMGGGE